MELVWLIVIIVFSTLVGLILYTFLPNFLILQFYTWHSMARLIEKKCCCALRWTSIFFHVLAYLTARIVQLYSWIVHSYQIVQLDKIPTDRPVLFIFYHGVTPADLFYFIVHLYFRKEHSSVIRAVLDKETFGCSCWAKLVVNYAFPGPAEHCVSTLQSGHSIIIAPGGVRECLFATLRYETLWNNRAGFARVAREAKVDIVPVFTRNIRQTCIHFECLQRWARPKYEKDHTIAVFPVPCVFPVKLVTYVGKAIPYDSVDSAEELAKLTQQTVDTMIASYQRFPATICRGILERFTKVQMQPKIVTVENSNP